MLKDSGPSSAGSRSALPQPFRVEIKRKAFHLTALIYVVAAVAVPRPIFLAALSGFLAAVILLEIARLAIPALNTFAHRIFGSVFRASERHRLSGVVWMLGGVLAAAVILEPLPLLVTALLHVILGDAAASIAGIRWGNRRWPGSNKTVVGSLACLAVCFLVGIVLLRPAWGWEGIAAAAVAATLAESGVLRLNDNLAIPVLSATAFAVSYGLW